MSNSGGGHCPYTDLHVYVIDGLLPAGAETALGNSFIGNWVEDESSFLFFETPADEQVNTLIAAHPRVTLLESHQFSYEQWQGGGFEKFDVAGFHVMPSWEKEEENCLNAQILLDPGVVFGNGLHATTRDCLRAIALTKSQKPFKTAIDLGTGTGVLSLAAVAAGAQRVLAVDLNPLCVKTAQKNVGLNDMEDKVRVVQGKAEEFLNESADLIIANIHHAVIAHLLKCDGFFSAERLIISGLLRSQFRDVREELMKSRYCIVREWDHDMTWFTLLAEKEQLEV